MSELSNPQYQPEIVETLNRLQSRVTALENENSQLRTALQSGSYAAPARDLPNTSLLSHNFLARAFAVWGHYFVAQLIITLVIGACYLGVILVAGAAIFGGNR